MTQEPPEKKAVLVLANARAILVYIFPELDAPEVANPQPDFVFRRNDGWKEQEVLEKMYADGYDVY